MAVSDNRYIINYDYTSINKNTFTNLCEFVSCKKTVYEVSVVEVGAAWVWTERPSTRKETLKSSDVLYSSSGIPSDWLNKLADDQCPYDAFKLEAHKEIVSFEKLASGDYAYQVRCVKEKE